MATNDTAASQTRFNTATQILEYAVGGNWVTVPGVGSSITAGEINSESTGAGQPLVADGTGGAEWAANFTLDDSTLRFSFGNGILQDTAPGIILAGGENDFVQVFTHFTNGIYLKDNPTGSDTIGVGTQSPADCAILDLTSVNHDTGLLLPRLTTVERDAIVTPLAGLLIYNTTTNKLNVYTTVWEEVTSA